MVQVHIFPVLPIGGAVQGKGVPRVVKVGAWLCAGVRTSQMRNHTFVSRINIRIKGRRQAGNGKKEGGKREKGEGTNGERRCIAPKTRRSRERGRMEKGDASHRRPVVVEQVGPVGSTLCIRIMYHHAVEEGWGTRSERNVCGLERSLRRADRSHRVQPLVGCQCCQGIERRKGQGGGGPC